MGNIKVKIEKRRKQKYSKKKKMNKTTRID